MRVCINVFSSRLNNIVLPLICIVTQIQEYTRKKNEREIAFEREQQKQKLLKEKSIAKIQANHQATYDLQSVKDELNALRVRDQVSEQTNYVPNIRTHNTVLTLFAQL